MKTPAYAIAGVFSVWNRLFPEIHTASPAGTWIIRRQVVCDDGSANIRLASMRGVYKPERPSARPRLARVRENEGVFAIRVRFDYFIGC